MQMFLMAFFISDFLFSDGKGKKRSTLICAIIKPEEKELV